MSDEVPVHYMNLFSALTGMYGLSCELSASIGQFGAFLEQITRPGSTTTRDSQFFFGRGDPNNPEARHQYSRTVGEIIERSAHNGLNDSMQYALCLVYLYSLWEHVLRRDIAQVEDKELNEISHAAFGDLRLLRQAILHKGHILDKDLEFFDFFQKGDFVKFSNDSFYLLVLGLYDAAKEIAARAGVCTEGLEFDRSLANA